MRALRRLVRPLAGPLAAILALATLAAPVQAEPIATDAVIDPAPAENATVTRAELQAAVDRPAVAAQLRALGVAPDEARARIAALSDAELATIEARLDEVPAGGDVGSIVGAAVIVFLVLLVTDILGYTEVFPFTRTVNTVD